MFKKFFNENAKNYSEENYNININKFMITRLNTIKNLVLKNFSNNKNIKVVDLGCGSGEIALTLAQNGYSGIAIDYSNEMIKIAEKKLSNYNWQTIVENAENTSLENKSVDLIIASGLIEYYPNDEILFEEINRVLKSNGFLIINVTNKIGYTSILNYFTHPLKKNVLYKFIKEKLFKFKYDTINYLTRKHSINKFKKILKENQFEIISERYIGYTLLPAPFSTIFNKFTKNIDKKLEILSRTKFKILGASYIVLCKKN